MLQYGHHNKEEERGVDDNERQYWIGFSMVSGIGPVRFQRLLDYFGDAETAWNAPVKKLADAGLEQKQIDALVKARSLLNLSAEVEKLRKLEKFYHQPVQVLTWNEYPERLRNIAAQPPLLYVRGELTGADSWAIGMVGTRGVTAYGRQVTEDLATALAGNQITVISGLARGVDAIAHQAALNAGGRTIAVLGCGIDITYPPEHARLASSIAEHGAIVSDYPLGTKPDASNFPPRNRIISGLSLGTVVVEADERSGAMITAVFALEQNREVFAVPGPITSPKSRGTNKLIQQGAKLVMNVDDIIQELNLQQVPQQLAMREILPDNSDEAALLKLLSTQPTHIDELSRTSGLPVAMISATLTMMELKGMVRSLGGMQYVLAHSLREEQAHYNAGS